MYEVRHPDSDLPYPKFDTWEKALEAQKNWNKECLGHKARKIPKEEIPMELTCPECTGTFTGWPHEKGNICFGCFADKELAAKAK